MFIQVPDIHKNDFLLIPILEACSGAYKVRNIEVRVFYGLILKT